MTKTDNGTAEVGEAVRHAATRLGSDLSRTARDARDAAEELSEALRHSASGIADKARARASAATHDVQEGVRAHPIAWLGAAAGVGALLSLLLASRSR